MGREVIAIPTWRGKRESKGDCEQWSYNALLSNSPLLARSAGAKVLELKPPIPNTGYPVGLSNREESFIAIRPLLGIFMNHCLHRIRNFIKCS